MTDELEEIRAQKREKMMNEDAEEERETVAEPVRVESAAHLDELVGSHDVVLVDFYADWCGPCKMMEPAIQTVASETEAVVAKVNIDQHQPLAQQNGVRGVPTLQLYANGEPAQRLVGMQDESTLRDLIGRYA
ncbi:thiol reductase thioredoxin [Haladaptatus sp. R4]|uniref:thioredoxin n=1 Tax=Haladaptatus sp. R4 TaxID=1679489 RepID=UPI0007B4738D|nr:thioredoxin [Haladaptatus sp. R4]KZN25977.1 thiol reductase thioredoxin [Haladaptatus sp. R4]